MAKTAEDKFPPQIKYIIGNEGCERFSFYGMRNILTVFMVQMLAMQEMDATSVFHIFVAACYLTPLAGAYLADRFFGKYKVIFWLSTFYVLGHAVIAVFETKAGLYWGLGLIAIGSGGIKPCVSAFGGDQFKPHQTKLIERYYSLFYWIINFGSAFSTLLTPWLLANYGPRWAFGIPGVLMFIALIIFWSGRKTYVMKPPTGKNPDSILRVLQSAQRNRQPGMGFLDGAKKDHPVEAVEGVRAVLDIMKIFFTAVPIFWALFDQHGSTWVLQARAMNPVVDLGFTTIKLEASQIQALNPFMVMSLIPLFVFYGYPFVQRFYNFTPLRRMGWGMVIASFSFVQVAIIQYVLDGGTQISILWQAVPYLTITVAEVLISITGLEFAYTQAPKSMKSTIMSFWMLTTFLGNLIVGVFAKINVFSGGTFFMFFALLMLGVSAIFAFMAKGYRMRSIEN